MTSFDILRDFLNLCDKTSAKWLTLHIGECGSGRAKMTDRIELLIEDFRKFYENNKFLTPIGIENLPYQKNGKLLLGDDFRDIKKIVDGVKDFKFLFDLGHYNVAYYNDNLNELYNYIIGVHIHDNNGDIDSHKELGTGTVNYEFIIRNILKLNSEVPFVIEYRDFDIDKIRRTVKKLKEI
ncbi:AP endonuclease, family 2 [Parvimonas sp. oral taxon 393 str. F0440]|nr:AP endonuclease, family 2 [Parvimonas sp. oral taxon 393 str. F0440]